MELCSEVCRPSPYLSVLLSRFSKGLPLWWDFVCGMFQSIAGFSWGCQGTFEEPQKRKPGKHALQTYCNSLQTKLCLLLCSKILWSSTFRMSHNLDWLYLSKTRLMISLSLCDLLYLSCSLLVSPKNLSRYCFWYFCIRGDVQVTSARFSGFLTASLPLFSTKSTQPPFLSSEFGRPPPSPSLLTSFVNGP